jgi:hypothetical protein
VVWRGYELVDTMAATLRVLREHFSAVFRPHLEPTVAAVQVSRPPTRRCKSCES